MEASRTDEFVNAVKYCGLRRSVPGIDEITAPIFVVVADVAPLSIIIDRHGLQQRKLGRAKGEAEGNLQQTSQRR